MKKETLKLGFVIQTFLTMQVAHTVSFLNQTSYYDQVSNLKTKTNGDTLVFALEQDQHRKTVSRGKMLSHWLEAAGTRNGLTDVDLIDPATEGSIKSVCTVEHRQLVSMETCCSMRPFKWSMQL